MKKIPKIVFEDIVRYDELDKQIEKFGEAYRGDHTSYLDEYLAFSLFIQKAFISKGGYIIDTGNFETVNYELMDEVRDKINKHPLLWKLFFMIA